MSESKNTIADLHALHNKDVVIPNRIREAIAAIGAAGKEWVYEADLRTSIKPPLSTNDVGNYRDKFKDFWEEMPYTHKRTSIARVWFASKKLADKWREGKSA